MCAKRPIHWRNSASWTSASTDWGRLLTAVMLWMTLDLFLALTGLASCPQQESQMNFAVALVARTKTVLPRPLLPEQHPVASIPRQPFPICHRTLVPWQVWCFAKDRTFDLEQRRPVHLACQSLHQVCQSFCSQKCPRTRQIPVQQTRGDECGQPIDSLVPRQGEIEVWTWLLPRTIAAAQRCHSSQQQWSCAFLMGKQHGDQEHFPLELAAVVFLKFVLVVAI